MREKPEIQKPGITVLLPTRGRPTIETLCAMAATDSIPLIVIPASRMGIIAARNELAKSAPKFPNHAGFIPKLGWYALWVDDDAFWRNGTISRILKSHITTEATHPGTEHIVAGWFTGRSAHAAAKAYRADGTQPKPGRIDDCDDGDVVEVDRVGFHFVLHRQSLITKMHTEYGENLFSPEGTSELGEDTAFCRRARNMGARIWVDTGCPIAHIDDDGVAYLPGEGPMRVVGSELHKIETLRNYGDLEDAQRKHEVSGGVTMMEAV